jgi:transposase-like protein
LNPITKKERLKPTPEELFAVYQECSVPGAPVKAILQRHGMVPWELATIRKKIQQAALDALAEPSHRGRKIPLVDAETFRKVSQELSETKDALVAVGHELALLKKRVS